MGEREKGVTLKVVGEVEAVMVEHFPKSLAKDLPFGARLLMKLCQVQLPEN